MQLSLMLGASKLQRDSAGFQTPRAFTTFPYRPYLLGRLEDIPCIMFSPRNYCTLPLINQHHLPRAWEGSQYMQRDSSKSQKVLPSKRKSSFTNVAYNAMLAARRFAGPYSPGLPKGEGMGPIPNKQTRFS